MTVSEQTSRPADAPPAGPEWKPITGARHYEASHRGKLRSLDRIMNGRKYRGVVLKTRVQHKTRPDDTAYELVDIRRDDGSKWTGTVHSFVLLAHVGPPPPGQETCHGPGGPLDNRWPENIRYGTKRENEGDKPRTPRPAKPRTPCINHERCGGFVTAGGRRCHECVVTIGQAAAGLLEEGARLDDVAELLGYPSPVGLHTLAVKYGGYGVRPKPLLRRWRDAITNWLAVED